MNEENRKRNITKQEAELRDEDLANIGGGANDTNPKRKTGELQETATDILGKKGKGILGSSVGDDGSVYFT